MDYRDNEISRRRALWQRLIEEGGPQGVRPGLTKELKLHRGMMGIYRDIETTRPVGSGRAGAAVGLLCTGSTYDDTIYHDGIVYHYPTTGRPGRKDDQEIQSLKNAMTERLPVFVITASSESNRRDVHLAWIVDYDDQSEQILVLFGGVGDTPQPMIDAPDEPLTIASKKMRVSLSTSDRAVTARQSFAIFKRYGSRCALCNVSAETLLKATYLCPSEAGGPQDARNALVLCLNHRRALRSGAVRIRPSDGRVIVPDDVEFESLGLTEPTLSGLPHEPAIEALEWLWQSTEDARP